MFLHNFQLYSSYLIPYVEGQIINVIIQSLYVTNYVTIRYCLVATSLD